MNSRPSESQKHACADRVTPILTTQRGKGYPPREPRENVFPHRSSTMPRRHGLTIKWAWLVDLVQVAVPSPLPAPRAMRRVLAYARAYPAISPHIPCAAARSCPCRAATPRGRGSFRGSSDTNVVHTRIAGGATAQRAVANRLHAYCAPATPEASPHHAHPISRC